MSINILVFVPIIIGLLITIIKQKQLWIIALLTSIGCLLTSITLLYADQGLVEVILFNGLLFSANKLGIIYTIVTSVLWLVTIIASKEYFHDNNNINRYYASLLITYGAINGIFLAHDLLTLFVFFEIMSFASYLWVIHNHNDASRKAGNSYLLFAVFGGLILLFGIMITYSVNGSVTLDSLYNLTNQASNPLVIIASSCMLIGFGCKAGIFMFFDWLPLAHTSAPAPTSGLLSGLLTKCGIFGIILVVTRIMASNQIFTLLILVIAILNMLVGAVFAFISTNLKRTLAFSSVSQIGFIMWGIALINLLGEHNAIAIYGTLFFMINHSLIKILLFNVAGIIYQNTHQLNLNKLIGYGHNKLWLKIVFLIGAMSLAGVPLLSGYISKTLLHEAMVEYIHLYHAGIFFQIIEVLFLVAGGFTAAYMFKLFNCIFILKPEVQDTNKHYVSMKLKITLSLISFILILLGLSGNGLFAMIGEYSREFFNAHHLTYVFYFSFTNLKGSIISLTIGALIYIISLKLFKPKNNELYYDIISEDISIQNNIYVPLFNFLVYISTLCFRLVDILFDLIIQTFNRFIMKPLRIPNQFYGIDSERIHINTGIRLSYSLSYSLLMFGLGFLFTVIYLLFIGNVW